MNTNSFDTEQNILAAWQITSDIDCLYEAVSETEISRDDIANILLGLSQLYSLKFEVMRHKYWGMTISQRLYDFITSDLPLWQSICLLPLRLTIIFIIMAAGLVTAIWQDIKTLYKN
jgi:hypothetical protein